MHFRLPNAAEFEEKKREYDKNWQRLQYLESRLNRINLTREFNRER
jgi:hypothetical protein